MDYQNNLVIKEEPKEYEDGNVNLFDYSANVKIENCAPDDWCVKNEQLFEEIEKKLNDAENNNQCRICGQGFVDRFSLFIHNTQHLEVIIKNRILQCDECFNYFTTFNEFKKHKLTHKNIKEPVKSKSQLKKAKKNKCNVCGILLPYKTWYEHMRWGHSSERYTCSKCDKEFKTPSTLRRHNLYVHDGMEATWRKINKVACNVCNKEFRNQHSLKTHINNCHSKSHQCYICKSVLKSKSYLMTHMRRVHSHNGNEHACEVCGKKFKSVRYVKIHIKNSHNKGIKKTA